MDLVSKEQYFVTVIIGDASECKHTDAFICGVKFSISGYELRFLQSQNKKKKKYIGHEQCPETTGNM